MGKAEHGVSLHVRGEILLVDRGLSLVRKQEHDDVRPPGRLGERNDLESGRRRALPARSLRSRTHHHGHPRVSQIQRVGVALIPLVSAPVLRWAVRGLAGFNVGLLVGSLLAVLVLFSVPGVLLGTATPWAIRLSLRDLSETGQTAR